MRFGQIDSDFSDDETTQITGKVDNSGGNDTSDDKMNIPEFKEQPGLVVDLSKAEPITFF